MTPHERLGFLQAKLRQPLPKGLRFNMTFWRIDGDAHCNAAACAFGYASMLPEMQADGLEWIRTGAYIGQIRYAGLYEMSAAKIFFDLSIDQAEYLFSPAAYEPTPSEKITPGMVADRIDEVIRQLDAETVSS